MYVRVLDYALSPTSLKKRKCSLLDSNAYILYTLPLVWWHNINISVLCYILHIPPLYLWCLLFFFISIYYVSSSVFFRTDVVGRLAIPLFIWKVPDSNIDLENRLYVWGFRVCQYTFKINDRILLQSKRNCFILLPFRFVTPYSTRHSTVYKLSSRERCKPLKRRVKSHLPSAGIIRSSPYSPR